MNPGSSLVGVVIVLISRHVLVDSSLLDLSASHAAFSLDLYKNLVADDTVKNVFFSPASISAAMAMVSLGSRGQTKKEIDRVLHFDLLGNDLLKSFQALNSRLYNSNNPYILKSANRLFAPIGVDFSRYYLSSAQRFYGSSVETMNFAEDSEYSRKLINTWVANVTEEKIAEFLPIGSVSASTVLMIVNAMYFRGAWMLPFKTENTRNNDFYLNTDTKISIPFMYQRGHFRYGRNEKERFDILELPYEGEKLAFYVLLPDDAEGLPEVESGLSVLSLSASIKNMRQTEVDLWMPKFRFSQEFSLRTVLQKLGIRDLFLYGKADLSGLNGKRNLFVSEIVHKSYVEVNERGTEAASSTGILVSKAAFVPPVEFRVDRPFLFMIREKKSGSVLFVGRVVRPTVAMTLPRIGGYRSEPVAPAGGHNSATTNLTLAPGQFILFMHIMCVVAFISKTGNFT